MTITLDDIADRLIFGSEEPFAIDRSGEGWTNSQEFLEGYYGEPAFYQGPLIAYAYHMLSHMPGSDLPVLPEGWQLDRADMSGDRYARVCIRYPKDSPWESTKKKRLDEDVTQWVQVAIRDDIPRLRNTMAYAVKAARKHDEKFPPR